CGNCNTACVGGQVCSAGMCALSCVGGTTNCSGKCVDTKLDNGNCGNCNTACVGGKVCSAGLCALGCVGGTTKCAGPNNTEVCTQTASDPANCGMCGTTCGAGQACVAGACKPLVQSPHAKAIAGGAFHTCALLSDDTVKCWGNNEYGQLGLGDTSNRGDGPNELGNALPAVLLGTGKTAKAIAVGDYHTCALLSDDTVKCWGYNYFGQLGLGDMSFRGIAPNQMGDALPAVPLGTGKTAKAIGAGVDHTCALLNDDTVKCWGKNYDGQLGLGDMSHRGDGPNELGDALPAVLLGTGKTAKAIAAGYYHTCALFSDDTVKCWGNNLYGQLGLGDKSPRGDGPNEMGDALPAVLLVGP
ncbi:MAG: hypothetical protein EXR75_09145, partial [Myxococcales bacterium]|nr:hypothetical protein [Myxococcales bacterium]